MRTVWGLKPENIFEMPDGTIKLIDFGIGRQAGLPDEEGPPCDSSLGSRIRRRLILDYASRDELLACLDHLLAAAGNSSLMTSELKVTLAEHAAGNYRVLMNLADELLALAADPDLPRLDDKLYLEAFSQPNAPPKRRPRGSDDAPALTR